MLTRSSLPFPVFFVKNQKPSVRRRSPLSSHYLFLVGAWLGKWEEPVRKLSLVSLPEGKILLLTLTAA